MASQGRGRLWQGSRCGAPSPGTAPQSPAPAPSDSLCTPGMHYSPPSTHTHSASPHRPRCSPQHPPTAPAAPPCSPSSPYAPLSHLLASPQLSFHAPHCPSTAPHLPSHHGFQQRPPNPPHLPPHSPPCPSHKPLTPHCTPNASPHPPASGSGRVTWRPHVGRVTWCPYNGDMAVPIPVGTRPLGALQGCISPLASPAEAQRVPHSGPQPCPGGSEDTSSAASLRHALSAPGLTHPGRQGLGSGVRGLGCWGPHPALLGGIPTPFAPQPAAASPLPRSAPTLGMCQCHPSPPRTRENRAGGTAAMGMA